MTTSNDGGWGQPERPQPRYGQYGPTPNGSDGSGSADAPGEASGWGQPQYGQPQYGQPQYGQPQYGQPQYGQPQYGQPQYGQPQYGQPGPGGFGGFVPSPKPGIIPLRPLRLGEFLDGAFGAIRANPRVMFGLTSIVIAVAVVLSTVATFTLTNVLAPGIVDGLDELGEQGFGQQGAFVQMTIGPYATSLLMALVLPIVTGLLIVSVSRSVIGRRAGVGEVWNDAKRRVGWLLLLALLLGVVTSLAVAVYVGLIWASTLGDSGWLVAGAVIGGLVLLVVFLVWFFVRTLLIAPALVLEGASFGASIARGWTLSRGVFWRLLGMYVLTQFIVGIVVSLIIYPTTIVATIIAFGATGLGFASIAVYALGNILAYTISTAFSAAVVALLYIDVRMRREGLDVELAAAADRAAEV
ncbi:MAG: glycerophosphoryl diester phosphodiesterase membrane domain-containing protein [Cellulomonadaceae bacterium]